MAERSFELPRVKVCGLTRAADVSVALAAGADALGFVHYAPSPRSVEIDRIAELVALARRRARTVLVVVDGSSMQCAALAGATGVDAVQLCGDQQPDDFRHFPLPILRRIGVDEAGAAELERFRGVAAGFVLDVPGAPGGTGRQVDRALAHALARRAPALLAGGLGPANVAEAVARVVPQGVDASSRLERGAGRKDAAKVSAFALHARAALSTHLPLQPPLSA